MTRDRAMQRPIIILVFICTIAQIVCGPHIQILEGHINFCLILTCALAFMTNSKVGTICGFCSGLFYDLLSVAPFGTMMLILTVVGFCSGLVGRNLFAEGLSRVLVLFVPAAFVCELLNGIFMLSMGEQSGFFSTLGLRMLPSVVLNIAMAVLVFFMLTRVKRKDTMALRRSIRTIK